MWWKENDKASGSKINNEGVKGVKGVKGGKEGRREQRGLERDEAVELHDEEKEEEEEIALAPFSEPAQSTMYLCAGPPSLPVLPS
jgi:hypothetical protein